MHLTIFNPIKYFSIGPKLPKLVLNGKPTNYMPMWHENFLTNTQIWVQFLC